MTYARQVNNRSKFFVLNLALWQLQAGTGIPHALFPFFNCQMHAGRPAGNANRICCAHTLVDPCQICAKGTGRIYAEFSSGHVHAAFLRHDKASLLAIELSGFQSPADQGPRQFPFEKKCRVSTGIPLAENVLLHDDSRTSGYSIAFLPGLYTSPAKSIKTCVPGGCASGRSKGLFPTGPCHPKAIHDTQHIVTNMFYLCGIPRYPADIAQANK